MRHLSMLVEEDGKRWGLWHRLDVCVGKCACCQCEVWQHFYFRVGTESDYLEGGCKGHLHQLRWNDVGVGDTYPSGAELSEARISCVQGYEMYIPADEQRGEEG